MLEKPYKQKNQDEITFKYYREAVGIYDFLESLSEITQMIEIEYNFCLIYKTKKSIYNRYSGDMLGDTLEPKALDILSLV